MTSTIEVRENTGHYGTATQVFRNSCVKMTTVWPKYDAKQQRHLKE